MDEQRYQYRMNPDSMPKPENRFMRIWGPLLIKWGIAVGVSMLAMMIFECFTIIRESGLDISAIHSMAQMQEILAKYTSNTAEYTALMDEMTQEFMKYTTPVEGVAALVTIPILLVMFHKDRIKERITGFAPNKKAALWKYAGIFIMTTAMTLGLNNLIFISGISSADSSYEETLSSMYSASLPVQLVCLGILIPVCEEMVFRGLMFRRIRQNSSFAAAALYSSVVFGVLHMNMVQMLYGFFLGMTFCFLYEKYGSVKAPIFAHISANVFSVLLTEFKIYDHVTEKPMIMGVITVLCATIASMMYVLIKKIEEKPDDPGKKDTNDNLAAV